ncbi:ABC transporter substrate-binding protein [Collimonas sp.]|jgi:branched-chain amino acid transport system substrate-binding protein|uniref:ABC transporter substrate-binding protein n=1 Tax=Collimonas sp. TaxID=1963772 RepID=UPI002CC992D5|nr:ABC transporter substrate-binding protein [Collimonas sp.]HWX01932.1 ABC transporter substrate-binding protein [Collimonas sp.]
MRFNKLLALSSLLLAAIAAQAETGVTASAITLGQSAAFSGPAKELGKGMHDGAQAYFDQVNASGGVYGRKIILKTLDDGYEPERAAANTKQFIEQDEVLALFGYVGTPTSNASIPAVSKAKLPFFAPFTGAQSLREPFNRNIFNIRASYFAETEKIVQQITTLSLKRIAVFYQNDAYGKAGLEGVTRALKKRGIEVAGLGTVERNSVDVSDAVAKIRASKPQTVIMVSAYNSSAAFIKAMIAAGSPPSFWNISFVGSQQLVSALGKDASGVQISQVMPAPWDETHAIVKEYRKYYLQDGKRQWDYVSMEGFIAAKVFVEGLRRAGSNLSRDSLIRALETISHYDAGGYFITFSPGSHNGSEFVDLTMVAKSGRFLH